MRVAVVGASGNAGTAVLRALAEDDEVTGVVGVARRPPPQDRAPYAGVEWHAVDLSLSDGDAVERLLVEAFSGVDAVVHLAWAIQPNTSREYLRRVNVDGTRRVAEATARAGVPHLVVASSWAAYSPVSDDSPRDESAPHDGIRSSHYSVDKAAQERVLDSVEERYPQLAVARVRPALIFQADAGAQIQRYFLGPLVPTGFLRRGALPALPLPTGVRLQIVHADDVAQAYLTVLKRRGTGAFNVAAADTLWPADLARLLDHGRTIDIPPAAIRPILHGAWRAGLVAADPGWLDMAVGVPVMDTTRIRALGWTERTSAEDALLELLTGMRERRGTSSPSLRAGRTPFGGPLETGLPPGGRESATPHTRGRTALPLELRGARISEQLDGPLLGLYLADHLSGATAGSERVLRMADAYAGTTLGPELTALADEIVTERELLRELMVVLGVHRRPARRAVAWLGERVGRLKLNRRVVSTSPLTPLIELELLRSGINGKLGLWQSLATIAPDLGVDSAPFVDLADLARDQSARVDRLHERVRRASFRDEPRRVGG